MLKKICLFSLISILFLTRFNHFIQAEQNKIAYLTFDDGPTHYTNKILSILDKGNIQATFFVIGDNIEKYDKTLLFNYITAGHYIGLHSMTHDYKQLYSGKDAPERFTEEMLQEQDLIYAITGFMSTLVRPPFSGGDKLTDEHIDYLLQHDLKVWDWNVDSRDWNCRSTYQILHNIQIELKLHDYPDRIVVLLHERKITTYALPYIIQYLTKLHYNFEVYDPSQHFPINFRHYDYI